MEGKVVPSQSLAKEVGTVPEPLRQNNLGQLLGITTTWISPGEGKEVLGLWVDRDGKESILYTVQDCEMGGGTRNERQESIRIGYHRVYRSHCYID
jgi:hypothetical protein